MCQRLRPPRGVCQFLFVGFVVALCRQTGGVDLFAVLEFEGTYHVGPVSFQHLDRLSGCPVESIFLCFVSAVTFEELHALEIFTNSCLCSKFADVSIPRASLQVLRRTSVVSSSATNNRRSEMPRTLKAWMTASLTSHWRSRFSRPHSSGAADSIC